MPTSFAYGAATVRLEYVTDLTNVTGTKEGYMASSATGMDLGGSDYFVQFLSGAWIGCDLPSDVLGSTIENPGLERAKHMVFSVLNYSNGDIYFCLSPNNGGTELYMKPDTTTPVLLVDSDGYMTVSTPTMDTVLCSGRYGWLIPEMFDGYVVVPVSLFCSMGDWTNSACTGNDVYMEALGFHFASNDATYIEAYVDDVMFCGDLPTYYEPGTVVPAPETNSDWWEYVETEPETNSDWWWYPETEPETEGAREVPVVYLANGGSGVPTYDIARTDELYFVSQQVPQRKGYTFVGWSRNKTNHYVDYLPGEAIWLPADVGETLVLYAIWSEDIVETTPPDGWDPWDESPETLPSIPDETVVAETEWIDVDRPADTTPHGNWWWNAEVGGWETRPYTPSDTAPDVWWNDEPVTRGDWYDEEYEEEEETKRSNRNPNKNAEGTLTVNLGCAGSVTTMVALPVAGVTAAVLLRRRRRRDEDD